MRPTAVEEAEALARVALEEPVETRGPREQERQPVAVTVEQEVRLVPEVLEAFKAAQVPAEALS